MHDGRLTEQGPPEALDRSRSSRELSLELLEGPEALVEGERELVIGPASTIGREVLPEDAVIEGRVAEIRT